MTSSDTGMLFCFPTREEIIRPTLVGFVDWLASHHPNDVVGTRAYGNSPIARYIEQLNSGTRAAVNAQFYWVNRHKFEWNGDIGGCFVEHLLPLISERFITVRQTQEAIEEARKIQRQEVM